jgi:hypothetical protein
MAALVVVAQAPVQQAATMLILVHQRLCVVYLPHQVVHLLHQVVSTACL